MRRPSRAVTSALTFALVLLVAGLPWPAVRRDFASVYAAVANGLLGSVIFGQGARVRFTPGDTAPDGRKLDGEVTVDVVLEISVTGYRGSLVQGLNVRRDAYIPLVILLAAVMALPLAWRQRLRCLLAATLAEVAVLLGSAWLLLVHDLALGLNLRGIYDLSPLQKGALDLAFRALLLPPGNRLVIPLVIVAVLGWRSLTRTPSRWADANRDSGAWSRGLPQEAHERFTERPAAEDK